MCRVSLVPVFASFPRGSLNRIYVTRMEVLKALRRAPSLACLNGLLEVRDVVEVIEKYASLYMLSF